MADDDALIAKATEALRLYLPTGNGWMTPNLNAAFRSRRDEAARAVIAAVRDQIAAEALNKVREEWQFGGWTILTAPTPEGAIASLALGQRVTDWLRARADRLDPEEADHG